MTQLSVNVNKLATLRNSRGRNNPDVLQGALDIIRFGGQGITVHPRPDGRHIRREDVYALKKNIAVELNIEGYPSEEFLAMVVDVRPAQCTLVPDPPDVITSNAGWDVQKSKDLLARVAKQFRTARIRSSVFVDPKTTSKEDYITLKGVGVDRVELFTERFADHYGKSDHKAVLESYVQAAKDARAAGLGVNAGHDLSLENLTALIQAIPWIDEVSIGHALICDALYRGLEETVKLYLRCIREGMEAAK